MATRTHDLQMNELRVALQMVERLAKELQDNGLKRLHRIGRMHYARLSSTQLESSDQKVVKPKDILGPRVLGKIRDNLIARGLTTFEQFETYDCADLWALCDNQIKFPGVAEKHMRTLRDAGEAIERD